MTRQLRQRKSTGVDSNGLILANGGVMTYQHVVILSSRPRKDGTSYPSGNPLSSSASTDPAPTIEEEAQGEAIIEVPFLPCSYISSISILADNNQTYTVEYARDGTPSRGHIVGRLTSNDRRFLANHADERTLRILSSMSEEQIGKRGTVWVVEGGRNVFAIGEWSRL